MSLPLLDANIVESVLPSDVRVQVIDALNISQSRAQQIEALEKLKLPQKDRTVTELDDEEERPSQRPTITKYTVKDQSDKVTFLLPSKPVQLKLGSYVTIQKGTKIWRSIIYPQPSQLSGVTGGTSLSIDEQLQKLRPS